MSKEKIISKREDFWLWSVSRSLSFKTYDLSKTKRREKLSLFSAVTLSHFHFHRASNETTTTSPPKGTFPFFRCARRLSRAEKRKEKDRITLKKFKNVRLLLVGKTTTTNFALLRYNAVVAHPLHLSIVIETIESDAQKTKMCTKRTMFNKFIPMVTSRSHR